MTVRNGCFGSLADATARLIEGPLSPLKADMLNISVNVHKRGLAQTKPNLRYREDRGLRFLIFVKRSFAGGCFLG